MRDILLEQLAAAMINAFDSGAFGFASEQARIARERDEQVSQTWSDIAAKITDLQARPVPMQHMPDTTSAEL